MSKTVIFDLYGMLLQFNQRAFVRDLARAFGLPVGGISAQGLRTLLVRKYSSESDMVADWCRAIGLEYPDAEQLAVCHDVLQTHLGDNDHPTPLLRPSSVNAPVRGGGLISVLRSATISRQDEGGKRRRRTNEGMLKPGGLW